MSKMQSIAGGKIYTDANFVVNAVSYSQSNSQNTTNGVANMSDGFTFTTNSTTYVDVITLNITHPLSPDTRGLYAFELTSTGSFTGGAPILGNNKANGEPLLTFPRVIIDAGGAFGAVELFSGALSYDRKTATIQPAGKPSLFGFFTLEPTATVLNRTMRFQVRNNFNTFTTSARNLRLRWWRVI